MEKIIKILAFRTSKLLYKRIFSYDFKIGYWRWRGYYSELLKILLIFLIGSLLNMPLESFIILLTFGLLRTVSGGYHAESFSKCLLMTVGLYSIGLIVSKIVYSKVDITLSLVLLLFIISTLIVVIYAPQIDREILKLTLIKYKILSLIYIICAYILIQYNDFICKLISIFKKGNIKIVICVGILLQSLTLTPVFIKLFSKKGEEKL